MNEAHANALTLATMIGQLALESKTDRKKLARARQIGLLPRSGEVRALWWERLAEFAGSPEPPGATSLPALKPDLLGERYVLERLGGRLAISEADSRFISDCTSQLRDLAWELAPAEAG